MRRWVLICILIALTVLQLGCIERPWNKPQPISHVYQQVRKHVAEKKYDEAIALLDQLIERIQGMKDASGQWEIDAAGRAKPYCVKGNILFSDKQYDEASTAYQQATRIDSSNAEAWLGGAFSLYAMDRTEQAKAYLESAKQSFEQRLNDVQIWPANQRIDKTYQTKLHIAIITGLLGYKDAAKSQLIMLQAGYPDLARTDYWVELIEKDQLLSKLMDLQQEQGL